MKTFDADLHAIWRIAALGMALCFFAGNAAADVTVIASEVPGIEPRAELKDDMTIRIEGGQSLTILLPSAVTKTVVGPFNGEVRELYQNPGFISRLYRLIVKRWKEGSVDESQGVGARFLPPVFEGGWKAIRLRETISDAIYCYEAGTFPLIAREVGRKGDTLIISDAASGHVRITMDWPENSNTVYWPSTVPPEHNGQYALNNSKIVNTITLKKVPSGSFSGNNIVNVLGDANCTPQLAVWLEETSTKK
ncbi:MAG TPA: hypothetical protein VKA94_16175 [Hyphomicrobiales bacterium]|nr:hypothetical protein [Hyphomicrobiales bacterium]